jgi:uncharacterized membrane protein
MRKLFKILIILDLLMVAIGLVLYYATANRDDFSGLSVIFPLTGFTIITVAILVLSFGSALRGSRSKNVTSMQLLVYELFLLGIPLLGLLYSISGDNRANLKVVSTLALVLAVGTSVFMIARNLRTR